LVCSRERASRGALVKIAITLSWASFCKSEFDVQEFTGFIFGVAAASLAVAGALAADPPV
jgi:hypothetical protein